MTDRAAALVLALALDLAVGEVGGAWHPVALAGRVLDIAYRPWHRREPATSLRGGTAALGTAVGLASLLGWGAERLAGRRFIRVLIRGVLLKQTFSIRRLLEEGAGVAGTLERGNLEQARLQLRALVSRPTSGLSPELCASAAIESLAENVADSIAAPLVCYSLLGLPAAAAYRVVNTADAMFGYRGEMEWLGKSAARLDDVLNWVPSRLSAIALTGAALMLGGRSAAGLAWRTCQRDGPRTASPNAGRPMAAMAGALGRRLEKRGHYILGAGFRAPRPADVRAAIRLTGLAAVLLAGGALLWEARR